MALAHLIAAVEHKLDGYQLAVVEKIAKLEAWQQSFDKDLAGGNDKFATLESGHEQLKLDIKLLRNSVDELLAIRKHEAARSWDVKKVLIAAAITGFVSFGVSVALWFIMRGK